MAVSKKLILGIAAIVVVIAMLLVIVLPYNSLVSKEQNVKKQWSNVKVVVQRQAELIPAVMEQVNVSMYFEQGYIANITMLRTQWLNTLANGSQSDVSNVSQQVLAQIGSFLQVTEQYPDIKSTDTIRELIIEMEGSQNRIASERRFYNDAVNDYNTAVHSFPNNIIAGAFGFQEATYFQE